MKIYESRMNDGYHQVAKSGLTIFSIKCYKLGTAQSATRIATSKHAGHQLRVFKILSHLFMFLYLLLVLYIVVHLTQPNNNRNFLSNSTVCNTSYSRKCWIICSFANFPFSNAQKNT
uniref:Uncharacterized protein n=1 Tax=Glossina palpalis gambiensis TaxID=67801 RepID=A0A1B0C0A7_9MUSC